MLCVELLLHRLILWWRVGRGFTWLSLFYCLTFLDRLLVRRGRNLAMTWFHFAWCLWFLLWSYCCGAGRFWLFYRWSGLARIGVMRLCGRNLVLMGLTLLDFWCFFGVASVSCCFILLDPRRRIRRKPRSDLGWFCTIVAIVLLLRGLIWSVSEGENLVQTCVYFAWFLLCFAIVLLDLLLSYCLSCYCIAWLAVVWYCSVLYSSSLSWLLLRIVVSCCCRWGISWCRIFCCYGGLGWGRNFVETCIGHSRSGGGACLGWCLAGGQIFVTTWLGFPWFLLFLMISSLGGRGRACRYCRNFADFARLWVVLLLYSGGDCWLYDGMWPRTETTRHRDNTSLNLSINRDAEA